MVMKMVPTCPAAIRSEARMRMNTSVKQFVGEVREHERRGKGQTRDRGRDGDRDGREDAHEEHTSKCFSDCRGKVVAFGVMPRVLFVERR